MTNHLCFFSCLWSCHVACDLTALSLTLQWENSACSSKYWKKWGENTKWTLATQHRRREFRKFALSWGNCDRSLVYLIPVKANMIILIKSRTPVMAPIHFPPSEARLPSVLFPFCDWAILVTFPCSLHPNSPTRIQNAPLGQKSRIQHCSYNLKGTWEVFIFQINKIFHSTQREKFSGNQG